MTSQQMQQLERMLGSTAVPICLVSFASVLVIYRHCTEDPVEDDPLRGFLSMIVIHMIPLVILQLRVGHCPDPMGMLSNFAPPVLLMHTFFLAPRVVYTILIQQELFPLIACVLALLASVVALTRGFAFKWSIASLSSDFAINGMVATCFVAGFVTELIDARMNPSTYWEFNPLGVRNKAFMVIANSVHTASNYIEITALVPAVTAVFRSETPTALEDETLDPVKQKQAALFFSFMTSFYIYEDVIQAILAAWDMPIAAMAHVAHFLLLLDFVAFFLIHVHNLGASKKDLFMAAICMV